ncbi:hypothetical protein QBC44DRAFT_404472, partial [Cladorrhinum sp. PSN332]
MATSNTTHGNSGTGTQNVHHGSGNVINLTGSSAKFHMNHQPPDRRDKDIRKLIRKLKDMAGEYDDARDCIPTKDNGTWDWFLQETEAYVKWKNSTKRSQLFWITAELGCGKSVLARHLVDYELSEASKALNHQKWIVVFFFFGGSETRATARTALSAILHQLLLKHKDLTHQQIYSGNYDTKTLACSFHGQWRFLLDCAKSVARQEPHGGRIICVLDGIDACERKELDIILDKLEEAYSETRGPPPSLSFIVTSRPLPELTSHHPNLKSSRHFYHFSPSEVTLKEEIRRYIDYNLSSMDLDPNEDREAILDHLAMNADKTYLWVYVFFKTLRNRRSFGLRDIKRVLRDPARMSGLFRSMIRLKEQNDEESQTKRRLLHCILLAATRSLMLQEADRALTLAFASFEKRKFSSMEELDGDQWKASFAAEAQSVSNLISINHPKISFLHRSFRTFLTSIGEPNGEPSFTTAEAHATMYQSCADFLFLVSACVKPESLVAEPQLRDRDNGRYQFLGYAASNWWVHYQLMSEEDKRRKGRVRWWARALCRVVGEQVAARLWLPSLLARRQLRPEEWRKWTDLNVACYTGVKTAVEDIIEEKEVAIDATGGYYGTPIQTAAAAGNLAIVELLLEAGADPNASGGHYRSALEASIMEEQYEVTKVLVGEK